MIDLLMKWVQMGNFSSNRLAKIKTLIKMKNVFPSDLFCLPYTMPDRKSQEPYEFTHAGYKTERNK